jgi:nucleoside-diphosphate-sugar epimerase
MRFLVTGATGLVGAHVVDRLLARGDHVRVLVRRPDAADTLRARGLEVHRGDLTAAATDGCVEGIHVVVHCAATVDTGGDAALLWPVNVEATERLLEASARAGVGRFVHLSSTAVYGAAAPPIAEDAPKRPSGGYGRSKWAAEEALWRHHARGLPGVALRPCVVYGAGDRHAWPTLLGLSRRRVLPLPRRGRRLLDLVHVADVADAVLAAAAAPAAPGRAYNLTDGESHSYRDILDALAAATGRGPAILPLPSAGLRLLARLGRRAARLRVLDLDLHYAIDAARRDLGYAPRVSLLEGVRRTLAGA